MPGSALKAWRDSVGLTQEKLAEILGVSREWVGKLETGDRPISANIYLRVEALKREQKFALIDPPSDSGRGTFGVVQEDQAPYGTPESLTRETRKIFEDTLAAAGNDPGRIGYLRELLLKHFQPPEHWDLHEQIMRDEAERRGRYMRNPPPPKSEAQGGAGR